MRIQYRYLPTSVHPHPPDQNTLHFLRRAPSHHITHPQSKSKSQSPSQHGFVGEQWPFYSSWSDANARAQTGHIHTQKKGSSQTLDTLAGHNLNTFDCALDAYIHTYTHTYIHTPFKFSFFFLLPSLTPNSSPAY